MAQLPGEFDARDAASGSAADGRAPSAVTLTIRPADLPLLQACVGFQAKALSDPVLRDRLYRLWCHLEDVAAGHGVLAVRAPAERERD